MLLPALHLGCKHLLQTLRDGRAVGKRRLPKLRCLATQRVLFSPGRCHPCLRPLLPALHIRDSGVQYSRQRPLDPLGCQAGGLLQVGALACGRRKR
jgi:hypothetical protein